MGIEHYCYSAWPSLNKYMNEHYISPGRLAKMCGFHRQAMYNMLKNANPDEVRVKTIKKLMAATGLSFEELISEGE